MGLIADISTHLPQTASCWAVVAGVGFTAYALQLVIGRLFFHPLKNIPGPFLARVTYWYEFYQDVILGGQYVKNYPALHEKYGKLHQRFNYTPLKLDTEICRQVLSSGPVLTVSTSATRTFSTSELNLLETRQRSQQV